MENTPSLEKQAKVATKFCTFIQSWKLSFFYDLCLTEEQLYLKMMKRWNEGGTGWMSDGVMKIIRGGGEESSREAKWSVL